MLINWWPVLLLPLPLLVIPLAVALGQVVRGGPVTVMSVGAGLGLGSFWLALDSANLFPSTEFAPAAQLVLWIAISALAGEVLLMAAWAIALAQTFRARQWVWLALLCLAVYFTFATLIYFESSEYATCLLNPAAFSQAFCGDINPDALPVFVVATYAAPVILLLYGLVVGARRRQPHALPDGLTVSRLGAEER